MDSQKLFRLDGRIAFISAARGHLGRAMTRALAQAGAHVILNGRDDAALAHFEQELRAEGLSVERAAFDACDPAALARGSLPGRSVCGSAARQASTS